jgi:signal transduction histidine kinase
VEEQRSELRETTARARAAEHLASIGTLAAGLAHEIGTPMGVIRGHAELLESAVSDGRGRWRLRTIREQIDRISNIMQGLLNMARPHAPVRTGVALGDEIERALSFLSEKLRRRAIVVERHFRAVPAVEGDPERLQQLFLNLILNAADAMAGGGTLAIAIGPSESGDAASVVVSDTGHGIPEEDLQQIFEPFYTTKAAGQGSGLGLMVAKGIVLEHGGLIEARSEPGRGTEFRILFPVVPNQAMEE